MIENEVQEYIRRIKRRWPADDIPLRPDQRGRDADPAAALNRGGNRLLLRLPKSTLLVALDERGKEYSSEEFAKHLQRWENNAVTNICFAIGSDRGLSPEVLKRADLRLSLSRMTLPHRIARLLLWEQIYRAADILAGGRYHRP